MDRRQPAMRAGAGAPRTRRRPPPVSRRPVLSDEPHRGPADDEVWHRPNALSRGWALTRLAGLLVAVGIGTGIVIGVAFWLTLTALDSSL